MKYEQQTMAKATLRDGAISFKSSIMVADTIRGMMTDKAQALLERVTKFQQPVRYTRFRNGAGHRSGFGAAKYPIKTASAFLTLVKQGVANAESKGLGVPLKISSVIANEASRPMHQGSSRGHLMKRTHVEIILTETEASKKREKKAKKAKVEPIEKKVAEHEHKTEDKSASSEKAHTKAHSPVKEQKEVKHEKPKTEAAHKPASKPHTASSEQKRG